MKKALLLFITASYSVVSFAQHAVNPHATRRQPVNNTVDALMRTTAIGDTLHLTNIAASDTLALYTLGNSTDSGYVTGPNAYGDMGFAEKYDFNGNDSSLTIIGVMAKFGGKVNPASAHFVNFKVWSVSSEVAITSTFAYNGFPLNSFDTVNVPVTQLGIGIGAAPDTLKSFLFPFATDTLNGAFYVGYNMNYNFTTLAGDTLGLYASLDGERISPLYNVVLTISDLTGDTTRDTVFNVQNATQWSDNTWHDNYSDDDSLYNNLAIYPIVVIGQPTGMNKVTRGSLSFYGNYPNPAVNTTNIKFALAKNADVLIEILNMAGQSMNTIQLKSLNTGEHIVPVQTKALAPGNYVYLIRTSGGDGVAGQMTVIR